MIATFKPFYPDVAEEVLNALEREFRGLLRKKHMDLSESRVKNIKFLSELVKFGLTPLPIIFHCLKVLLEDFVPQNIIVACALLETCGRFLKLKSTATSARLDAMLDILKRKKAALHLEPRFLLMIDNAYYQVIATNVQVCMHIGIFLADHVCSRIVFNSSNQSATLQSKAQDKNARSLPSNSLSASCSISIFAKRTSRSLTSCCES